MKIDKEREISRTKVTKVTLYFITVDSKNLFLVIFIYLVCKVLSYVLLFDKPISIFCNHKRVLRVISIYLMGIISRACRIALMLVFIHLISSNIGTMKSYHTINIVYFLFVFSLFSAFQSMLKTDFESENVTFSM